MNHYKRMRIVVVLSLLLAASKLNATVSTDELRQIFNRIKQLKVYSYRFQVNAEYPNGDKDQMKGEVAVDAERKCFYQKSNLALVVLNNQWLLKANYDKKELSIFRLEAYAQKHGAQNFSSLFQNTLTNSLIDSVVLRYGTPEKIKAESGFSKYQLNFPKGYYLQSMQVNYDQSKQLPQSISVASFTSGKNDPIHGLRREMIYSNYNQSVDARLFNTDAYFTFRNGKIELKQFKDYKLYSVL